MTRIHQTVGQLSGNASHHLISRCKMLQSAAIVGVGGVAETWRWVSNSSPTNAASYNYVLSTFQHP